MVSIKETIEKKALKAESRLPSVRTLAAQHGVSLITALKALGALEDQGLIYAKHKSGFILKDLMMLPVLVAQH